jgi:hypothetical protein
MMKGDNFTGKSSFKTFRDIKGMGEIILFRVVKEISKY